MDEPNVVRYVKKHLKEDGWTVQGTVQAGNIGDEQFIPDILAIKNGKIMVIDAKGSVTLNTIITGIGQCVADALYGGTIVCFAVPEDVASKARTLIKQVTINGGKIGLFEVKKNGKVILDPSWKEIKLPKSLQGLGKSRIYKLAFVRDLKVDELGRLLKIAYDHRTQYNTQKELSHILVKKKSYVFKDRKSVSWKSAQNAVITTVNLGLIDTTSQLTYDGINLKDVFIESYEKYKEHLGFLLLTKGNWLALLESIVENQNSNESENFYENVIKSLIKKGALEENIKIVDYAHRIRSNHINWLKEIGILELKKGLPEIKWNVVCSVFRQEFL